MYWLMSLIITWVSQHLIKYSVLSITNQIDTNVTIIIIIIIIMWGEYFREIKMFMNAIHNFEKFSCFIVLEYV